MDTEQSADVADFLDAPAQPPGAQSPPVPPTPPSWNGEWGPGGDESLTQTPRRRWRFLPRSLTGRLVVGVVTLVIVVVSATGIGTYYALRSFLYERLDQQLQTTAGSINSIRDLLTGGENAPQGVRAPQTVWVVALDTAGNDLISPSSPTVAAMALTPSDRRMLVARTSSKALTVHTATGVELRVTTQQVQFPTLGDIRGVVVIGLSTDEVERTLDRLLKLELAIGASALLVALVATAWGVRFSLRRLHRVTATAQEVAAELSPEGAGLDRRVEVVEEGTEVGKLAASMNTLLAAVETQFAARLDSERRMRQFMADASHELRTPLTSIRGYAELARMQRTLGATDASSDVAADNLERIESEGTRMSRLVEDLLTLARGDQGSLPDMEPIDVAELLEDVVDSSRAAFPHREIELDDVAALTVMGDQDQLLRAIRNLVSNAATHTQADGAIEVRAFASGPGIAIQVVDHGPGLPPEEAAHVFERFWRADKARTRARGGTGLGLAIVVSIVQMHGGTVQFQSTVQDGSTVTVWLPARTS